jgi:hypothetical protein
MTIILQNRICAKAILVNLTTNKTKEEILEIFSQCFKINIISFLFYIKDVEYSIYLKFAKKLDIKTGKKFSNLVGLNVIDVQTCPSINIFLNEFLIRKSNGYSYFSSRDLEKSLNLLFFSKSQNILNNEFNEVLLDTAHKTAESYNKNNTKNFSFDVKYQDENEKVLLNSNFSAVNLFTSHISNITEIPLLNGYLTNFNLNFNQLTSIINNQTENIVVKQQLLENLSNSSSTIYNSIKYNLSPKLLDIVNQISFLLNDRNFEDYSVKNIANNMMLWNSIEKTKRDAKMTLITDSSEKILKITKKTFFIYYKIKIFFLTLDILKQNIGLLLTHTAANIFRECLDNEQLSFLLDEKSDFNNPRHINFITKLLKKCDKNDKETILVLRRTKYKSKLLEVILKQFSFVIKVFNSDLQIKKQLNESLTKLAKESLNNYPMYFTGINSSLTNPILELKDPNLLNFTLEEEEKLGDILMAVLDAVNFLKYYTGTQEVIKSNQIKSLTLVTCNPNLLPLIFETHFMGQDYPMIVKPSSWKLESKKVQVDGLKHPEFYNELNYGGYLSCKKDFYPGLKQFQPRSFADVSLVHLNCLNTIQATPFKVNKIFLTRLLGDQFRNGLFHFLDILPNLELKSDEIFFEIDMKNNEKKQLFLKTFNHFFQDFHPELQNTFKKIIKKNDESNSNKYYFFTQLEKLQTKAFFLYRTKLSKILTFLDILLTAYIFQDFTLYFNWFFDHRFRIYPRNGIFNPHGCTLVKSLLDMQPNDKKIEKFAKKDFLIKTDYSKLCLEEQKNNFGSKYFNYMRYSLDISSYLIELDVSGSGFQILSGMCGYINGLKLTNLLKNKNELILKKKDFNLDFWEALISYTNSFLYKKNCLPIFYEILQMFINSYDRSFIKNLLICFLYSEGHFSRTKKLVAYFETLEVFTEKLTELYKNFLISSKSDGKDLSYRQFMFKACTNISHAFIETFASIHSDVYNLKTYLEKVLSTSLLIKERCGIVQQICPGATRSFYSLLKDEVKTYHYQKIIMQDSYFKIEKATYNLNSYVLGTFNHKKALSSISPNLVHSVDGEILCLFINLCLKKKIPIVPSHDSIKTFISLEKVVKKLWAQATIEIILKIDILEYFFKLNNKEGTEPPLLFYELKKKRTKILSDICNGSLEVSDFCLN